LTDNKTNDILLITIKFSPSKKTLIRLASPVEILTDYYYLAKQIL